MSLDAKREALGERTADPPSLPEIAALAATIGALSEAGASRSPRETRSVEQERLEAQLRFRRVLGVACGMWLSFTAIDWISVEHLGGPPFTYFLALRVAVLGVVAPVLYRLYRRPAPSAQLVAILDVVAYTTPSIGIALMCAAFHGLASPYAPGLCLVLLARTVAAQEPWRRGLVMAGIPVLSFYVVLLSSALVLPGVAAQLHSAPARTTLILSSAYILGTYVILVVGGNVVWSLRQQIFEARSLGRYRLKRLLASGGMGDVWVAYHPGLKRDVAVKILRHEAWSDVAVRRFEREVRATTQLSHPNTVRIFDYGVSDDGLWYYAMELLEGESVAALVAREGALATGRALRLIGQAARALAEAHAKGIVHRDVKPENLLVTTAGGEPDFVKVLDFGIASVAMAEGDAKLTRTGAVMGTLAWLAPEAIRGDAIDARADVYALGAILYLMLAGRPPFEHETAVAVMSAHLHERPAPPSSKRGGPLPHELEAIVLRCLEKDPEARYPTAEALAEALEGR